MESRAFFLKYRPQKISQLGLSEIRDSLSRIFQSDRIPQSFLFVGNKGTGKTSAARIVAKIVNCQKRKSGDPEPCNQCPACLSIQNGSAIDISEIDAASNRGIDDIRSLREQVRLMPAQLKYKVYIIDEVHMLTNEAFNALLKTLEEPPAHTVFILATTNPEKLPATIVSRCLKFNFRKVTQKEIADNLAQVAKAEGIKAEQSVFKEIARRAEGSFRDGQKILEQLSVGRKELLLDEVKTFLGQNEAQSPQILLEKLADQDLDGSLLEIERLAASGADFGFITETILDQLRQLMLAKLGVVKIEDEFLLAQLTKLDASQIKDLVELLLASAQSMKFSPIVQLPLEVAVVDWLGEDGSTRQPKVEEKVKASDDVPTKNLERSQKTPEESKFSSDNLTGEVREIDEMTWRKILAAVKPLNHSIEALLRGAKPLQIKGNILTLEVFYKFHKEQLEDNKRRNIVEGACRQIIGDEGLKLQCVLGEKSAKSTQETKKDDIIDVAQSIFGK